MGRRLNDFPTGTKDILAKRVGVRCSNPNCRRLTSGPRTTKSAAVNIGVAAHIAAASKGGPRWDEQMSPDERRSPDNGIWLCQVCAKVVDNDPERHPAPLLRQWKELSEHAALLDIERPEQSSASGISDVDLIKFFAQCFDRPAFQDHFHREGSMEAFDRAIEDTITAINTGCLRSRDNRILSQAKGKAFLRNPAWRDQMDVIVDLLRAVRSRYADGVRRNLIHVHKVNDGDEFYAFHDPHIGDWMDQTRSEIMRMFGAIADQAGVRAPVFPRFPHRW